jgi:hypothetical protein
VLDEFGHRAPFEGDDRGAASHRLDDGEAERLVPVSEVVLCTANGSNCTSSRPNSFPSEGPLNEAGSERKAPVPLVPPHITDTFDLGGLRWS